MLTFSWYSVPYFSRGLVPNLSHLHAPAFNRAQPALTFQHLSIIFSVCYIVSFTFSDGLHGGTRQQLQTSFLPCPNGGRSA